VVAILCAHFPGLAAAHNLKDLREFVRATEIDPDGAASVVGWFYYTEREFKFMKVSLLKQLWAEFSSMPEDVWGRSIFMFECPLEELKQAQEIYEDWQNRDFDPDDVAA
jgi:hypothetical protein